MRKRVGLAFLLLLFCFGCGRGETNENETEALESSLEVVVHVGDEEVLRVPLDVDAVYAVTDASPRALTHGEDLKALGDEALPARHDVNLITIEDNRVYVSASNCANQVCVGMGAIDSDAYDFPIVCLPHYLVVTVE